MLSRMLIVSVCILLVFFGCTHFGDGALRKSVTDAASGAQVDVVQVGAVQEKTEADADEDLIDPQVDNGHTVAYHARIKT